MDIEQAREFVRSNHRAVLATFRRDGRPALSPVLADVDPEGYVVISTRETAMKTRHVERDPRVALCVLNPGFFGAWIQVEGTASILRLPDAMEPLVGYYRRTAGEHPDWADYRAAMARERRVLLRIAVDRAGPDVSG